MRNAEEALQATVKTLFRRHPALAGFAVEKHVTPADGSGVLEQRFSLSELAVDPALGEDLPALLEGEIVLAIADLLEDRPDAAGLIAGRTFARTLH